MSIPRHWRPLREIDRNRDFKPHRPEIIAETMKMYEVDAPTAVSMLDAEHEKSRYFINDLYQVMVAEHEGGITHINIRRTDGGMFKDWRHFQQIKNQVTDPEREAIEIYPAESRLTDTSNKWHLWVMPAGQRIPIGFSTRDVQYEENRNVPGMRQRPL